MSAINEWEDYHLTENSWIDGDSSWDSKKQ